MERTARFLETRVAEFGERPLIALGDERLTYREAAEASARLALGLLAAGVGKGSRVGLLQPNGPGWVVASSSSQSCPSRT